METGNLMSQSSKREYLKRIYPRYQKADVAAKQRILDEFCANCSYHRKHAIRLLRSAAGREAEAATADADLRFAARFDFEGGLGGCRLSLVGAAESAAARVDALDAPALPAHPRDRRSTAQDQRSHDR